MKIKTALTGLVMLIASACSDDESPYECSTCVDEPEALAANDASGKGVYKGVFVGSSGYIKFIIANADATISATLVIDGVEYPLSTEVTYNGGFEGYFYGTKSNTNDIKIGFYVSADGLDYGLYDVVIPGHDEADIELIKELSTELVAVFEGTYSGGDQGTFNVAVHGTEWVAIIRGQGSQTSVYEYGTISETGEVTCPNCDLVVITGTRNGDNISGTWNYSIGGLTGKWRGKRTL